LSVKPATRYSHSHDRGSFGSGGPVGVASVACFNKLGAGDGGGPPDAGAGGGGVGSVDGITSVGGLGGGGGIAGRFSDASDPGANGPADGNGLPGVCPHAAPAASKNATHIAKAALCTGTGAG